jgi:hypothetical protein
MSEHFPVPNPARIKGTHGLAEVERLTGIARVLYEAACAKPPTTPWNKLSTGDQRPWIDKACDPRFGESDA